jgi:hypothetical protein
MRREPTLYFLMLLFLLSCRQAPPLKIRASDGFVTIDFQTLGEYSSSIDRVRVSTRGVVLWDFASEVGEPQLHSITLFTGINKAEAPIANAGKYRVIASQSGQSFDLPTNQNIHIEAWRRKDDDRTKVEADFIIQKK